MHCLLSCHFQSAHAKNRTAGNSWARVCDDMFSAIDESFLATWDVEIEESETTPGYYRLVNPFGNGNCPYFGDKNNFKANDLYIHAEDPEHVWME